MLRRAIPVHPPGLNRTFFQYSELSPIGCVTTGEFEETFQPVRVRPGQYMKGRTTQSWNSYRTEFGVQCTTTHDPSDRGMIFCFKNFSDKLIRIRWQEKGVTVSRFLEPQEDTMIKVPDSLYDHGYPELTAYNMGDRE